MKIFFTVFLLFNFFIGLSAQEYFHLTPDGFKSKESKDYIIINNNLSTNQNLELLTKAVRNTIIQNKDTKITIDNNEIQIYSYELDLFRVKSGLLAELIMDIDYNIKISIKDGKYRIEAPIISNIGVHRLMIERMVIYANPKNHKEKKKNQFIFDYQSRKIKNNEAKEQIEIFFNNLIDTIIKYENEEW